MLFVASACAPAAAPAAGAAPPPEQITVTGTDDFRFSPSTITVQAGQPLDVTFQNGGEILHDFTVQQGLAKPIIIAWPVVAAALGVLVIGFGAYWLASRETVSPGDH